MSIICAGECLIDMIPTEQGALNPVPGGAVMNTAIGLGRLGVPVSFLSGISTDMFGTRITAHLNESDVDTALSLRSDRPTTLAFVDEVAGRVQYTFYDENTAGRTIEPQDMPDVPPGTSAVFGGCISLIGEPAADAYADFFVRASGHCAVMLDLNVRPGFVTKPEVYRARLRRLVDVAQIVKVSDEDLEWLYPDISDPAQAGAQLLQDGPDVVLLTRGPDGAEALHSSGARAFVPSVPTKVVDTVGAGDTFDAGFLAQLHDDGLLTREKIAALDVAQMERALSLAVRCASVTVSRVGAQPPRRDELS